MSGEYRSTVTVNQSEYDRLQRAERNLRTVNSNLPQVLAGVRQEAAENLRRGLAPLEERQRRFERNLGNLGEQMRRQERRTLDLLQQQRQEFEGAIADLQGDLQKLSEWTAGEFHRQRQEYLHLIEAQRLELQNEIDAIDQRITNLEERERRRRQLAGQWIKDATILAQQINQETQHQRFAPGELAKSQLLISQAQQNLAADAAQTALGNAQQACTDLCELRVTMQFKEAEWQIERVRAWEQAKNLSEQIAANRIVTALDLDGKEIEGVTVDVNVWTNGKLQQLKQELEALLPQLQNPSTPFSTTQLHEISGTLLPAMAERLELAVHEARLGIISAQQRYDIANILATALEGQGFTLYGGDCFYEQSDERLATIARLKRKDGAEVAIRVVPTSLGSNELEIHSFDHLQITEHQLQLRQNDLCNLLRQEAPVEMGPGKCRQEPDFQIIKAVEQAVQKHQQHG